MKSTQYVPMIIAFECLIGFAVALGSKEWGKAIYWLGGTILNIGLAL